MDIYKYSNKNFDANGDISLSPTSSILKVSLNGICEVELQHPYDKEGRWKQVINDNVLSGPTPWSQKQLFRIYEVEKGMFSLLVKARHIFFDLIDSICLDRRAVNKNGQEALNIILEGTVYSGISNINKVTTTYFVKQNRVASINGDKSNTFISSWGGEILWDNFNVIINDRQGGDYGVDISYGNNLLDINLKDNQEQVATRVYPVAFDGIMLPEKYVDSPLINTYSHIKERFLDCNDLKLKSENSEEGFTTEAELFVAMRKRVQEAFSAGIDKPTLTGDVNLAILENTLSEELSYVKNLYNIGLGDDITAHHMDIGIDIKTRCIGYEWDMLNQKYLTVSVGEIVDNYFDTKDKVEHKVNEVINDDGSVKADHVQGTLNAVKTKFRALKDIAQTQHVRAMLFEDLDPTSPTHGAMCIGTMGFEIASQRTPDNKEWDFRTFGTGQGFFADFITAGTLNANLIRAGIIKGFNDNLVINLDNGEVSFKKGKIQGENLDIDLNSGTIKTNRYDEYNKKDYEVLFGDGGIKSDNCLAVSAIKEIMLETNYPNNRDWAKIFISNNPEQYHLNGVMVHGNEILLLANNPDVQGCITIQGNTLFNRPVRITDDLTVTGTINGTFANRVLAMENIKLQEEGLI